MPVDLRDFGLNPQLCARVQDALRPGEQVRWAGQPVFRHLEPDRENRVVGGIFLSLFGLVGVGIMYLLLTGALEPKGLFGLIVSWFMAIVFLMLPIGVCIIAPWLHAARLRNTVYVITSSRAIVCGSNVEFWPLEPEMVVSNAQAKDGCGNLVFSLRPNPDGEGKDNWIEVGFIDIRDVRLVEEILEKAIAEREKV